MSIDSKSNYRPQKVPVDRIKNLILKEEICLPAIDLNDNYAKKDYEGKFNMSLVIKIINY